MKEKLLAFIFTFIGAYMIYSGFANFDWEINKGMSLNLYILGLLLIFGGYALITEKLNQRTVQGICILLLLASSILFHLYEWDNFDYWNKRRTKIVGSLFLVIFTVAFLKELWEKRGKSKK